MSNISGYGTGIIGGVKLGTKVPDDRTSEQLLRSIAVDMKRLADEYVTQPLFQTYKQSDLGTNQTSIQIFSNGVPVQRVYIQLFTDTTLDIFFSTAPPTATDVPDFRIGQNTFPTIIPYIGKELTLYVRNSDINSTGNDASYAVTLSSAAG